MLEDCQRFAGSVENPRKKRPLQTIVCMNKIKIQLVAVRFIFDEFQLFAGGLLLQDSQRFAGGLMLNDCQLVAVRSFAR